MKRFKLSRTISLLLLALSLVVAAGCQAVGGLDLNKMLKTAIQTTSSESSQTLEFKLELDEEALADYPEEEVALIRLLSDIKLEMSHVKLQDANHLSAQGSLQLGEQASIGFDLRIAGDVLVLELEGAKQPFVFDASADPYGYYDDYDWEEEEAVEIDQEAMVALGKKMIELIGDFAIDNLPNPSSLKVESVNEPINGVNTSLMHVQFEMNGQELWQWAKDYVNALVNDREGLDAVVAGVLELFSSNEEQWSAAFGGVNPFVGGGLDAPTQEETAQEASEAIAEMLLQLQEGMTELEQSEDGAFIEDVLKDALTLKSDTYVDGKLDIRKQQFELNLDLDNIGEEYMIPIKSVHVKSVSEQWNVNGAVEADAAVIEDDAVSTEDLMWMTQFESLQLFQEDSFVYDLLKNQFGFGTQTYFVFNTSYYNAPIIVPGYHTIVALRDVAESFGAEVIYDPETLQVTINDEWGGNTIVVQIGSDVVVVNGEEQVWPFPATVIDGSTYVAARKLAEALGADIEWTPYYEDIEILTIERKL